MNADTFQQQYLFKVGLLFTRHISCKIYTLKGKSVRLKMHAPKSYGVLLIGESFYDVYSQKVKKLTRI